jgi:hypothetical protein
VPAWDVHRDARSLPRTWTVLVTDGVHEYQTDLPPGVAPPPAPGSPTSTLAARVVPLLTTGRPARTVLLANASFATVVC